MPVLTVRCATLVLLLIVQSPAHSGQALAATRTPIQHATGIEQGTGRHIPYHINRAGQAIAASDLIIGRHVEIQRAGIRPLRVTAANRSQILGLDAPRAWGSAATYWPDNTVYYTFHAATPATRAAITQAIRQIESHSALQFVVRTNQVNYIEIHTLPAGECKTSALGMQGQRQILALGSAPECTRVRSALHVLMHALGAGHTYLRPDRDQHVKILEASYANRINPHLDVSLPFDYASVTNDTHLIRASRPENQVLISNQDQLSAGDIQFLQRAYPSKPAAANRL
jgi:hypothetical protein